MAEFVIITVPGQNSGPEDTVFMAINRISFSLETLLLKPLSLVLFSVKI